LCSLLSHTLSDVAAASQLRQKQSWKPLVAVLFSKLTLLKQNEEETKYWDLILLKQCLIAWNYSWKYQCSLCLWKSRAKVLYPLIKLRKWSFATLILIKEAKESRDIIIWLFDKLCFNCFAAFFSSCDFNKTSHELLSWHWSIVLQALNCLGLFWFCVVSWITIICIAISALQWILLVSAYSTDINVTAKEVILVSLLMLHWSACLYISKSLIN